jgi:hypothetical protein
MSAASTRACAVHRHHPVARGQQGRDGEREVRDLAAQAVDQQHGRGAGGPAGGPIKRAHVQARAGHIDELAPRRQQRVHLARRPGREQVCSQQQRQHHQQRQQHQQQKRQRQGRKSRHRFIALLSRCQ